ncbi:MAG: hypothetical protein P8J87_14365 [Verrucomicrobiales bacterium]|nr:hypothetical protein [Verrucomicrobiales bacterium]
MTPHGNDGNKFAKKPPRQIKDAAITIRCRRPDLNRWKRAAAAAGQKPADWCIAQLNQAQQTQKETE